MCVCAVGSRRNTRVCVCACVCETSCLLYWFLHVHHQLLSRVINTIFNLKTLSYVDLLTNCTETFKGWKGNLARPSEIFITNATAPPVGMAVHCILPLCRWLQSGGCSQVGAVRAAVSLLSLSTSVDENPLEASYQFV